MGRLEYEKRPPVMQGFQSENHFISLFKGILKPFVECVTGPWSHLRGSSQLGVKMNSL